MRPRLVCFSLAFRLLKPSSSDRYALVSSTIDGSATTAKRTDPCRGPNPGSLRTKCRRRAGRKRRRRRQPAHHVDTSMRRAHTRAAGRGERDAARMQKRGGGHTHRSSQHLLGSHRVDRRISVARRQSPAVTTRRLRVLQSTHECSPPAEAPAADAAVDGLRRAAEFNLLFHRSISG